MAGVKAERVNEVLRLVRASGSSDEQLTVLAIAFAIECRSQGVAKEAALAELGKLFDSDLQSSGIDRSGLILPH